MKTYLRDLLLMLTMAAVVYFGIKVSVQNYIVLESCMQPNFYEGQRIIVNKIAYKFHEPQRGDVIILKPPPPYNPATIPFIKRIIALPGETIEVKDGEVYVNNIKLYEPYIKEPPNYALKYTVAENQYFVLGDNRNVAEDSHYGWTVPRQNIIGKAWVTVWPLDKWGFIANYSFPELVRSAN